MAEGVQTYSARHVLASLGNHAVSGPADGDFLTIASNISEGYSRIVGAYGEVVRSMLPDWTYTLTFLLLPQSATVIWCNEQYKLDRTTGDGLFPVLVKDLKGMDVFFAEQGWIASPPGAVYGVEASPRPVVIHTGEGTWNH